MISPIVRIVCGVLGIAGAAAIAYNALTKGVVEPDFAFISSVAGALAFLYVAFFGRLPGGASIAHDDTERSMTKAKWQFFWAAAIAFLAVATAFLASKGVFEEADIVVLAIVGVLFAIVGVAIYFYVKDRPEDTDIRW